MEDARLALRGAMRAPEPDAKVVSRLLCHAERMDAERRTHSYWWACVGGGADAAAWLLALPPRVFGRHAPTALALLFASVAAALLLGGGALRQPGASGSGGPDAGGEAAEAPPLRAAAASWGGGGGGSGDGADDDEDEDSPGLLQSSLQWLTEGAMSLWVFWQEGDEAGEEL